MYIVPIVYDHCLSCVSLCLLICYSCLPYFAHCSLCVVRICSMLLKFCYVLLTLVSCVVHNFLHTLLPTYQVLLMFSMYCSPLVVCYSCLLNIALYLLYVAHVCSLLLSTCYMLLMFAQCSLCVLTFAISCTLLIVCSRDGCLLIKASRTVYNLWCQRGILKAALPRKRAQ